MPRAVKVWTWRRALRDHGPDRPGLLLTLYTLSTFANDDGFAFPSQTTLAKGARASVRTIRRHLDAAVQLGWIGVEVQHATGQGWRRHVYRCSVPDHVQLGDLDAMLADAVASEHGDVQRPRNGHDTSMSASTSRREDTILSARSPVHADTIVSAPSPTREDIIVSSPSSVIAKTCGQPTPNLRTPVTERADTGDRTCGHSLAPLTPQELLRNSSPREGADPADGPAHGRAKGLKRDDPKPERMRRARRHLLEIDRNVETERLKRDYRLTDSDIAELRAEIP